MNEAPHKTTAGLKLQDSFKRWIYFWFVYRGVLRMCISVLHVPTMPWEARREGKSL